jgi:hypothetical protein
MAEKMVRRRRTKVPRIDSDGGKEEDETADLPDSSASLGEASYVGIGGDVYALLFL